MSKNTLLPLSKSCSAHCLSSSHCSTGGTHRVWQDARGPLCPPCLLQPQEAPSPAEFTWGNEFYFFWVSAGMGTTLGTGTWMCLPMSQQEVGAPCPHPGCAAAPVPGLLPGCAAASSSACCQLLFGRADFWQSCSPPCITARGSSLPRASAPLLGGITRLLLPILPARPLDSSTSANSQAPVSLKT